MSCLELAVMIMMIMIEIASGRSVRRSCCQLLGIVASESGNMLTRVSEQRYLTCDCFMDRRMSRTRDVFQP